MTGRHALVLLVLVLCGASGCRDAQFVDPNDPKTASSVDLAMVLRRNIRMAADALDLRVSKGEITDQQRRQLLAQEADSLLAMGNVKHCAPRDAWIYADLMIAGGHYEEAIPLLKTAVRYATEIKDDDRRVNDSLRLARCLALTGKTKESLDLVQAVIDSKPSDPGPLLPSVLLEITPATEEKGHDPQLAHVLEEAIHEHLRMKVDPNSEAGQMFLMAKKHHIRRAWETIVFLLEHAGEHTQATAAAKRGDDMMRQLDGQQRFV